MPVFTPETNKDSGENSEDLLSKLTASEQTNKSLERKVEKLEKKQRKSSKHEAKELKALKAKNERTEELLKKAKEELKQLKGKKSKKLKKELADATAANRRENKELKIQIDELTKETEQNKKTIEHLRTKLKQTEGRLDVYEVYKTDESTYEKTKELRKLRRDVRDADTMKQEWEDEMKNQESTAERRVQKAQGLLAEFQKTNKELRSHNGYLQMRVTRLTEEVGGRPSENARRLEQLEDWNQESRRLLADKTRRIKELETQFGVASQPIPGGRPHVYEDDYGGRGSYQEKRGGDDRYGGDRYSPRRPAAVDREEIVSGSARRRMAQSSRNDRDRDSYRDRQERDNDEREPVDAYAKYGAPRPKPRGSTKPRRSQDRDRSGHRSDEDDSADDNRPAPRKSRRRDSSSDASNSDDEQDRARGRKRSQKLEVEESESHSYDDVIEIDDAKPASNGKEYAPKSILKKPKAEPEPKAEPVVRVWKKYIDPKGRPYYHDHVTAKTQWTRPEDFRI